MPVLANIPDEADGFLVLKLLGILMGVVGLVFFLGAAVGMVRFPDFYTRMHAAGKGDTLYIGSAEVCQMLTILLTEFLEGVPGLDTPGDVRRMSDIVAKKIRLGIGEIRRHRQETGGEPLPSIIIRGN